MKSKRLIISLAVLLLVPLFLVSCSDSRLEVYEEALTALSDNKDVKTQYDYILFIPYRGCGGCVGTTVNFLKKNESTDVYKVYYDYQSIKDLKIRMGEDLNKDTFIDTEETLFRILGPNLYPEMVKLENGVITHYEVLDPWASQTYWGPFAERKKTIGISEPD